MFELVFVLHMITGFLQEFHPPGDLAPVRNLEVIFSHYVNGEFKYNLIPLIPFTEILKFRHSRLFYLIKLMRLRLCFELLSDKNFLKSLRRLNDKKMKDLCEKEQSELGTGVVTDWSSQENSTLK